MAQKTDVVIYIDRASVEHNALVVGVNNLNPDVLDVTYFDLKSDALKTEFGVPHMSDESKKETNPELPQYSLNCWKNYGEEHLALPVDHPANDHPFELKKQDDSGRIVAKARPEFEKHLAEVAASTTEEHEGEEAEDADITAAVDKLRESGDFMKGVGRRPAGTWPSGGTNTPLADGVPHDGAKEPLGLPPLPKVLTDAAEASIAAEQRDPSLPMGTGPSGAASEIAVVEPSDLERRSPDAYFVPPAELDVIAQLDAAGPAPVEEKKPEDAA